ncbi:MAG: toll/interleukin-1 receptor domain-containing protein [Alphaproteobacteria bacterium]|nr:MAG: toll/interleukin-1 receptor domain-containing protein [Alphaproteobacteria bacterium]
METLFNKPRVFLSHSKRNVEFIEKLAADLQKCQIDPWLDSVEIRHGKSWQDSIFEHGLPSCDAIIVYFTEESIQSNVVKKEIDVGLLQNLKDSNIAFLPYVRNENLRTELRPDLQALQVPEWNDHNYYLLLPRVVAEIWRSYLERTVSSATKNERLKRVEAELELEKYKNLSDDIFSASENKEFQFVWDFFKRTTSLIMAGYLDVEAEQHIRFSFTLHLSTLVALLSNFFPMQYYGISPLYQGLTPTMKELISSNRDGLDLKYQRINFPDFRQLTEDLLVYGLLERYNYTSRGDDSEYLQERLELSKKYYRFRFWLAYHQNLPDIVSIEFVGEDEHQ